MSAYCKLTLRAEVAGPNGLELVRELPISFALGVGDHVVQELVTLTGSAYTALTPPTGAKAVLLALGDAPSLSLKSVTGDGAGLTISPATLVTGGDHWLWLGATPTLGILNSDADDAEVFVIWF